MQVKNHNCVTHAWQACDVKNIITSLYKYTWFLARSHNPITCIASFQDPGSICYWAVQTLCRRLIFHSWNLPKIYCHNYFNNQWCSIERGSQRLKVHVQVYLSIELHQQNVAIPCYQVNLRFHFLIKVIVYCTYVTSFIFFWLYLIKLVICRNH